jgi:FkbM family methyltransferase
VDNGLTATAGPNVTPAEAELINSGFRPKRLALPVLLVRRVLWPFIRPFHFHTLRGVMETKAELHDLETSLAELHQLHKGVEDLVRAHEDLVRAHKDLVPSHEDLARAHKRMGSELLAVVNRQAWLEERSETAVASAKKLSEELRPRLAGIETGYAGLSGKLQQETGPRLVRLETENSELANRLSSLEQSTDQRLAGIETGYAGLSGKLQQETGPRLVRLETENSELANRLSSLEQSTDQPLAGIETGYAGLSGKLQQETGPQLVRLETENSELANRLSSLEQSTARIDEADLRGSRLANGLFLTTFGENIVLLKAGELISETVRRTGEWDPHIMRVGAQAASVVRARTGAPNKLTAIDVGAHFGLITVSLARIFDKIISFEPNSFNVSLLRTNVLLNGLFDKVEVRPEAVSASVGRMSLAPDELQDIPLPLDEDGRFAPRLGTNLGAYTFVHDGTGLNEANAISLDSLAQTDIAFIKVDTQGGDGAVLTGAVDTIARCRPWLVFEWERVLSSAFSITFEDVKALLRQRGYEIRMLHRHNAKQVDYLALPAEEVWAFPDTKAAV